MKIFVEVFEKSEELGMSLKSKNEFSTLAKAKKGLSDLTLQENQTKRIHKCYHDEPKNKPCEIING